MEKIYILETEKIITNYSYIKNLEELIGADLIYFIYSSEKNSLREATEVEKSLIKLLYEKDQKLKNLGL